ncbi:hypothetical protein [Atlantibacter subterraneus]|uniref:hypothetical protein n=1 Tax=Atlantibacter subterraneus TaxID=255519 RepID=UPI00289ABE81|nr:hypothetical protein [Atlantibacter subterranea]
MARTPERAVYIRGESLRLRELICSFLVRPNITVFIYSIIVFAQPTTPFWPLRHSPLKNGEILFFNQQET